MANGNVTAITASVNLIANGGVASADTGVVTSGIFNGQNLLPCYIPSASLIPGAGTVTSVGLTVPSFLSVSGSPVTTAGTLAVSLATQTANTVFAGPASGAAAAPTFRSLVSADLAGGFTGITSVGTLDSLSIAATGVISWAARSVLAAPVDGTLQITTAAGAFGKLLLGAAASTTGIQIVATNGTFTLQTGAGAAANLVCGAVTGSAQVAGSTLVASSGGSTSTPSVAVNSLGSHFSGLYSSGTQTLDFTTNALAAGTINSTQQWSNIKRGTASKTTAYPVVATDSNVAFDNMGAAGVVTFTLPSAVVGQTFSFTATVAQQIKVQAGGSDAISMFGNNKSVGGLITGPATVNQGASVEMVCTSANMWAVTSFLGTWT